MTSAATGARKQYPPEVKRECAHLFLSGRMQIREISKRRKIAEGNITRWVAKYRDEYKQQQSEANGSNGAVKEAAPAADPPAAGAGTALAVIQKGETGRYTADQKALVLTVIKSGKLSVTEIAERTGIHLSTLYAWTRQTLQSAAPVQVEVMPDQERGRNTMQAVIHLRKAKSELISGIRKGAIDDFDNVHLNCLLALNALSGK